MLRKEVYLELMLVENEIMKENHLHHNNNGQQYLNNLYTNYSLSVRIQSKMIPENSDLLFKEYLQ